METVVIEEKFGCRIRLTAERQRHIIVRHPEIEKHLSKIPLVLQKPEIIVGNLAAPKEQYYHRYFPGLKNYLVIIVNLEKQFVVTAFISRKIKKGKIIWKSV